ncbi:hypothetical protein [Mycoplasma sp. ATU-Cv-508]|uniref:hypothetical protein n=1 Tax=Mycoplasma sp. ATU-Cv-508 TaxID=2048001 RepID=UPI000FDD81A8
MPSFRAGAEKAQWYKKRQLDEYRRIYQKPGANYDQSGMYLPAWERVKLFSPIFFAIVLVMIGIGLLINL